MTGQGKKNYITNNSKYCKYSVKEIICQSTAEYNQHNKSCTVFELDLDIIDSFYNTLVIQAHTYSTIEHFIARPHNGRCYDATCGSCFSTCLAI